MENQAIQESATVYAFPAENINKRRYALPLRGGNPNPMIDAATPLLGMVLRLKDMVNQPLPEQLYKQVVADIESIEQLLQTEGYEPGTVLTFRYVLCTFIDEVALGHGWHNDNGWLKQSLLVHFHNETWGGEKVFEQLELLMGNAKRYQDLLAFIYLCFCLGFRGRYKVTTQHQEEFERIFKRLYQKLDQSKHLPAPPVFYQGPARTDSSYRLIRHLTPLQILAGGALLLFAVYLFYLLQLDTQTADILQQLNGLLSRGAQ